MNFKLRRNSHEIHHLKAEQLSGIWHSHMLYNHHLYFQNIPTALKGTPSPLAATRHSLLPQRLATPSLLSVSTDLPVLDISYGCNRTQCGLLHLAYLTQRDIFMVCPCYSTC